MRKKHLDLYQVAYRSAIDLHLWLNSAQWKASVDSEVAEELRRESREILTSIAESVNARAVDEMVRLLKKAFEGIEQISWELSRLEYTDSNHPKALKSCILGYSKALHLANEKVELYTKKFNPQSKIKMIDKKKKLEDAIGCIVLRENGLWNTNGSYSAIEHVRLVKEVYKFKGKFGVQDGVTDWTQRIVDGNLARELVDKVVDELF